MVIIGALRNISSLQWLHAYFKVLVIDLSVFGGRIGEEEKGREGQTKHRKSNGNFAGTILWLPIIKGTAVIVH